MKEVVRELRKRLNLSQLEAAALTGISIVTINRAENTSVKLKTYQQIIERLQAEQEARRIDAVKYPATGLCYY